MANSNLVLSVSETMATLMKSMGKYTYYRINNPRGKESYRLAMRNCIKHVSSGYESIELIKARIEGMRIEVDHLYPSKLFDRKHEERDYYKLAIDHASDIVSSIESRFITGQWDSEPRAYQNKGEVFYEDESLFE